MFVDFLEKEFRSRHEKNARYSLRSFARALKIDPSTLSQILRRRRKATPSQAFKILRSLEIDSALKSALLLGLLEGRAQPLSSEGSYSRALLEANGMDRWEFYAILSLLELGSTRHSVTWIAKRLRSTPERVSYCISGLEEAGYLVRKKDRWEIRTGPLTTPLNQGGEVITRVLQENAEQAILALRTQTGKTADFSGWTIAMNSSKYSEACRRIREFRRSLSDYLSDDPKDSVYRMNIQFFRIDES